MRTLSLLVVLVLGFGTYAFADGLPVTSAPASAAPAVTAGFIGILVAIIAGLNVLLSAVQQIFSNLAKTEPGWLQSTSSVILSVSKYLGSNPNV